MSNVKPMKNTRKKSIPFDDMEKREWFEEGGHRMPTVGKNKKDRIKKQNKKEKQDLKKYYGSYE